MNVGFFDIQAITMFDIFKSITALFTLYFGELPVAEFSGELTTCAAVAAQSLPHGHHAWLRDSRARCLRRGVDKHATPAGRRLLRERGRIMLGAMYT